MAELDETAAQHVLHSGRQATKASCTRIAHLSAQLALAMADAFGILRRAIRSCRSWMFHANGWGIPFAALRPDRRSSHVGRQLSPSTSRH